MCGRFTLFAPYYEIMERFRIEAAFEESDYVPSYNISPSQQVVAIINDGEKNRLGHLRWGLIPPWAKDEKIGYKMINARAETLAEKPSYRNAFSKKRCIIPADSFYEWQRKDGEKVPMRIKLKTDELFAIAGLWETWKSPDGKLIHTCTAITTEPNELVKPIHNRMPVILKKEDEGIWLDPKNTDIQTLGNLLKPFDKNQMNAYSVSSAVNSPKNNEESLILPVC
ncbi:SOS response-associated peptidase [Sporosarcina thermotolerans]|uniref:Abasic site processing protein n=1 Tax=Sporosarcina thermotolerans TaxID=633404 RepID=A0AAW9AD96_9BACL|nr:SOS response-associated peptidase [Sporosarcina thermotolerans]MDW0117116.1 SOS response-associated peptidase [Sporosarcina thermotolerans]WHT47795.1 SOS response-associated peptidase [Sporosarcina thermotolerans]